MRGFLDRLVSASDASEDGGRTLKEVERLTIEEALSRVCGNRSRAARLLGIARSTLRRKMAEYGIETDSN